ncbi:hypothetical protein AAHH88_00050 [Candidatus Hodgkinia cicadicola]
MAKLGFKYSSLSSRRYQNEFVAILAKALIDGEVHFGLTGLDLVSERLRQNHQSWLEPQV